MALNPSYYETAQPVSVSSVVQYQEHLFHLYAHQQYGVNEFNIVPPKNRQSHYGQTNVYDWDIRDGPDTRTAKVVARLQGLCLYADRSSSQNWYNASNMVFTDQSFKGSTISVQGVLGPAIMPDEGEWAVVGGTGQFACAQGTVSYKRIQASNTLSTIQLQIRVVCLTFPKPDPVQKVGPWGGNGGTAYEIQQPDQLPQRLESVRIYKGPAGVIGSIQFSYIDQAGQKRTVGPWGKSSSGTAGGQGGYTLVSFGSSEIVQELYGATGDSGGQTVVTALTIVTNVRTYGPIGIQHQGNTPFHVAAPDNHSIVGFYGRADGQVLNQIGAYVTPNK